MVDAQLSHSPRICKVRRVKWNMILLYSTHHHSEGEYHTRSIANLQVIESSKKKKKILVMNEFAEGLLDGMINRTVTSMKR